MINSLKAFWNKYKPLLKMFTGIILLGVLFWQIRLPSNALTILKNNIFWAILTFCLALVGILLSSLKLILLLRFMDNKIPFITVIRAYYIGTFFNNFLPTSIGGDVVKFQEIRSSGIDGYKTSSAILMERATGLSTAIGMMGFVCISGGKLTSQLHLGSARFYIAGLSFLVLTITWGAYLWGGTKIQKKIKSANKIPLFKTFGRLIESLNLLTKKTRGLLFAFIISFFFYLDMGALLWAACMSLGEQMSYLSILQLIPFITVVSAIPLSIGGLGLNEGIRTLCLSAIGINPGIAFSIALLIRISQWIHSGIGGLFYIIPSQNSAPHKGKH